MRTDIQHWVTDIQGVLVEAHAAIFILVQLAEEARDKLLIRRVPEPPSCGSTGIPRWTSPSRRKVGCNTWMQPAEFMFVTL